MSVFARQVFGAHLFFTLCSIVLALTGRGGFFDTLLFHQTIAAAFLGVVLVVHAIVELWRIWTGAERDESREFLWQLVMEMGTGDDADGGDGDNGGGE